MSSPASTVTKPSTKPLTPEEEATLKTFEQNQDDLDEQQTNKFKALKAQKKAAAKAKLQADGKSGAKDIWATAILIGAGCGVAMMQDLKLISFGQPLDKLAVPAAFAIGLFIAVVVFGADANPVVSIARAVAKMITWGQAIGRICKQFIGGIGVLFLLREALGTMANKVQMGATHPNKGVSFWQTVSIESAVQVVLAVVVGVLGIMLAAIGKQYVAATLLATIVYSAVVGFVLMVCIMFAGSFDGGVVNEVRHLAPELVQFAYTHDPSIFHDALPFVVAMVIAGIIAGLILRPMQKAQQSS